MMAHQLSVSERQCLESYVESDNVGSLYDSDDEFAALLRKVISDFEYPDYAWMTVAQVKTRILAKH